MRLLRHLFAPSSRRLFPEDSLQRITEAIATGERQHRGEVHPLGARVPPVRVHVAEVEARDLRQPELHELRDRFGNFFSGVIFLDDFVPYRLAEAEG